MAAEYYENHPDNPNNIPIGSQVPPGRPRPDESDIEEIRRDFPPASYYQQPNGYSAPVDGKRHRRRKGDRADVDPDRRTSSVGYDAGGGRRRRKAKGGPRYRDADYYYGKSGRYRPRKSRKHHRSSSSDDESTSRSPSPKPRRRKSLSEHASGALAALGFSSRSRSRRRRGYRDDDRYDSRRRDKGSRHHRDRSESRSSADEPRSSRKRMSDARKQELRQSLTAALTAGAAEAYRVRKEPGGWNGAKGKRVLTAALGAGGVDGLLEHNSSPGQHDKRHFIESAIAGLATDRLVNGSESKSRSRNRHGRRTRSEDHGGLKGLASSGLLAAAGKEAYKHYKRSKSRGNRDRSGGDDDGSSDGEEGYRRRGRSSSGKRRHSLSGYLSKGLGALGLDDDDDGNTRDDYYKSHRRSRRRHGRYRSPPPG